MAQARSNAEICWLLDFYCCGYLWISVDVDSLISILSHCNFQLTHVDIVDIKICQATWIRLDPLGLGGCGPLGS